jgi:hypothetical protein
MKLEDHLHGRARAGDSWVAFVCIVWTLGLAILWAVR